MARKVVVPENKDGNSPVVSKRRHRGLSCLLAFLITCLVIFAIVFGIGWYFGDMYSKEYLGMPLSDTVGVLNGLYWTKDKDVVKRPYSESDLDGFYDEIKQNILLKEDADVDFDSALKSVLSDMMKQDGSNSARVRNSSAGDDGEDGESGSEIMNVLIEMVASAFTRENIDIERLSAYSETEDNYIFTLRDRELAAFVNSALEYMLGDIDVKTLLGDVSGLNVELNNVVKLKQIYFGAATTTNELGENVISATTANITVWVGLEDVASNVAAAYVTDYGLGWLSGLVKFAVKGILPKNVYATVTVPLQGDAEAHVLLNDMSVKKRDKAYQIINAIMALTSSGEPTTVQEMLAGLGEKITPYVEMITGEDGMKGAFDQAAQGNIRLDLIDMLAKLASKDSEDADPLTKSDFMYLLQAVLTSDPDNRLKQLQPYLYEGWYVDGSGRYEYKPADTTGYTAVDYETEFVRQLADKYSLDVDGDSLNDVLALLGVSLDGSAESPDPMDMLDYVDGERFTASLDRDIDELKLRVTDRMLAAALSNNLGALGGEGFENLSIKLDALSFIGNAEKPTHTYALLAAEIGLSDMLGSMGDSAIFALVKNVLPEKLVISIQVDITRSLAAGDAYDDTEFILNDYDNTTRALEAIGKLSAEFDLAAMSDKIGSMLRDMLNQLYEKLDIELVASDISGDVVTQGAILMPDVFTLMTELVLTDNDGNRIVEPEQFKNVLRGLNDRNGFSDEKHVADDYSGFIGELKDKYYFNEIVNDEGEEVKDIAELSGAIGGDFNGDRLRVVPDVDSAPEEGLSYLAYDTRAIEDLKPIMSCDEIALLIDEKLSGSSDASDFEVLKVTTGDDSLELLLMIEVGELLPDNIGRLLNISELYVTATVDMSRTVGSGDDAAYPVTVTINNMDDDTFKDAIKVINHIGGSSLDITSMVAEFGKILYDQISSIEQSLGVENMISFTDNGLELTDFYDFLINKTWSEDDGEKPETKVVKSAVQGMYRRTDAAGFVNPANYVVSNFVTNDGAQMDLGATPDEESANVNAARAFLAQFMGDLGGYDAGTFPPASKPRETKTDVEFNAYFDALMIEFTKSRDMVRAVQTFVLAADNTSEAALAVREKLNGKLKTVETDPDVLEADKDYMAVTFRLKMEKFMVTDSSVSIGFLPEYVYATIVLEKTVEDGKTKFVSLGEDKGVIFNDLSAEQYNVLIKLMSLSAAADDESHDENKINIVTITRSSVDGLNKLTDVTNALIVFGESTTDGIGTVKYENN